jgi:hypothetical protein
MQQEGFLLSRHPIRKALEKVALEKKRWNISHKECMREARASPEDFCSAMPFKNPFKSEKECKREAEHHSKDFCDILQALGIINPAAREKPKWAADEKITTEKQDYYWIGGKLLKMKQDGTMPESGKELVDFMLSTCGSCQDKYASLIKAGASEEEARKKLLKDMDESLQEMEKEVRELSEETDGEVTKDNEIVLAIQEMAKALSEGQQNILKLLSKEEPPVPPKKDEEEEEEEEPEVKAEDEEGKEKDKDPVLTLAEKLEQKGLTQEELSGMLKASGYQLIESSPAPGLDPTRSLTKGSQDDAQQASSEEIIEKDVEAMRKLDITSLEQ